jgi:hypothetical protein
MASARKGRSAVVGFVSPATIERCYGVPPIGTLKAFRSSCLVVCESGFGPAESWCEDADESGRGGGQERKAVSFLRDPHSPWRDLDHSTVYQVTDQGCPFDAIRNFDVLVVPVDLLDAWCERDVGDGDPQPVLRKQKAVCFVDGAYEMTVRVAKG